MTTFESSSRTIYADRKSVFGFLSDINNFDNLVPEGKVKDFQVEGDTCRFTVDGLGDIGIRLVSTDPDSTIRFESEGSAPFRFSLLIRLKEKEDKSTDMKLTFEAELNMMMKMMASKPLEEGLDYIALELSDHLNKRQWT